jgi:serine/threonine-protein kinase
MGPAPRLVIAMAQYRSGRRAEARKTLAAEMTGFDWSPARANSRDHWIWHVLRREAEALIVPDLPALLRGHYEPRDKDERLVLLGTCRARNLTRAAARLYAAAFAADPRLAEDSRSGLRYKAACAAASAGCGIGADVAGMDEVERAALRKAALSWLREELSGIASAADGRQKSATLKRWQSEPELAGLREAGALAKLPAPERAACTAFWEQVATALEVTGSTGR